MPVNGVFDVAHAAVTDLLDWYEPGNILSIAWTNFIGVFLVPYGNKKILSSWATWIPHLSTHNGGFSLIGPLGTPVGKTEFFSRLN